MSWRYPTVYVSPECYGPIRIVERTYSSWNSEYRRWKHGIRATRKLAALSYGDGRQPPRIAREAAAVLRFWRVD